MDKQSFRELSAFHRVIASSVGGLITALVMTPLDVIKIRMQMTKMISRNNCFIYCNGLMEHLCTCPTSASRSSHGSWYRRPGNFSGVRVGLPSRLPSTLSTICVFHVGHSAFGVLQQPSFTSLDAVFKIIRNEGFPSLWSGLSPTLVMALPQTVIYYTVNDWLKDRVGYCSTSSKSSKLLTADDLIPPLVGGTSRVLAVFAITPLDLLRTKIQSVQIGPREILKVLRTSVKQNGLQSLWTGIGPTLLRDLPYSMIFWLSFDYMKSGFLSRQVEKGSNAVPPQLSFYHAFTFGAFSGLLAGIFTHPFDVIKTHKQIELGESLIFNRPYPKSTWASLYRLYSSGGPKALFAGFTPRLLKTTNASAIMIATFESFKLYFTNQPV